MILNIDTSTENASVCIAVEGKSIGMFENEVQKDHAAWIHPAIQKLLQENQLSLRELKAVAVTAGPGSYTGLRVAMSTAKGLCYALNIPLITENTLRVMALASAQGPDGTAGNENILHCPMIDARRLEVFTALFDLHLEEIITSRALILEEQLFSDYLDAKRIIFSGNGSKKFRQFLSHPNAIFSESKFSAIQLAQLSHGKFMKRQFDDIAYAEPLYLKEFYTVSKK